MQLANVILDESCFGKSTKEFKFVFFTLSKEGKENHITVGETETLIAVTKEQHKAWKNQKIYVKEI
jgi:hypothetical protein